MTVTVVIVIAVIAAALQIYLLTHGLDKVTYDLRLSDPVVDIGQKFTVSAVVENKKAFPVLFLRLSEHYPEHLDLNTTGTSISKKDIHSASTWYLEVVQSMYLMPHQRLTRTLDASIDKRGVFFFREALLSGGDLFGLKETHQKFLFDREIVVLPEKADIPDIQDVFGNFLGDISVRRFILEDPVLTLGFREYSGREPMKSISWPRSLREGKLMVKQYDYTMELSATVILNVQFPDDRGTYELERSYSLTRGVCEYLEDKRISYSFITNSMAYGTHSGLTVISDGLGQNHLMSVLEELGKASLGYTRSFSSLLDQVSRRAESGRAHILVTVPLTDDDRALVRRCESRIGTRILIIEAQKEAE